MYDSIAFELGDEGAIMGYLPYNSYLISATAYAAQLMQSRPDVVWVGDYLPEYKVDARVSQKIDDAQKYAHVRHRPKADEGWIDRMTEMRGGAERSASG